MDVFVKSPTPDFVWVFSDYKQAEAMVVAWAGPVPSMKHWFRTGQDVHLRVAQLIARAVVDHRITMPRGLFATKLPEELTKEDPERQTGKNCVHANNYGLGVHKFALLTGLPVGYAKVVQEIYHRSVPEIKGGYQAWIKECLKKRRIYTPMGWKYDFYGAYSDDLEREAFALYPQSTVGHLLVQTLCEVGEVFEKELPEADVVPGLRYYSSVHPGNSMAWTPKALASRGLDNRLNVHDSIGVSTPNDRDCIDFVCRTIKRLGEVELLIKDDVLVIPLDFKVGPNWGDAHDYEVAT